MGGIMKKFIFIIILLSFFSLFSKTHNNIEVLACPQNDFEPGETLSPQKSATAKKWRDRLINVLDNSLNCLPANVKTFSETKMIRIQIICDSFVDCGRGGGEFNLITIPINYDEDYQGCGCGQSTLLHELIHISGIKDENVAYGCEKKCWETLKKWCTEPSRGKACNCK
jgi:hypothetical protein